MVGIDQRHRLEEILKWLLHWSMASGVRSRGFSIRVWKPRTGGLIWEFANLLGRYEEAKAHNAPIAAERQRQADERRAQQEVREQQLAQERQARYDSAFVRPKEILWRERR